MLEVLWKQIPSELRWIPNHEAVTHRTPRHDRIRRRIIHHIVGLGEKGRRSVRVQDWVRVRVRVRVGFRGRSSNIRLHQHRRCRIGGGRVEGGAGAGGGSGVHLGDEESDRELKMKVR